VPGRATALALAVLFALLAPGWAAASGAWTTFTRAYTYRDLLAEADTVWCATGEAGLLRYRPSDRSFVRINREPGGLASNSLSRLLRDRHGRLWVATLGAGASRLSADGTTWDLVNRFDGLPSDSVTAFAEHGDTVMIGTTRGIALWDGTQVTGALPNGFDPSPFTNGSDWITGIVAHGDSAWVTTQLGVYRGRFSQGLTDWAKETAGLDSLLPYQGITSDGTTLMVLGTTAPFRHPFDAGGPWILARDLAGGGALPPAVRIYEDLGKILLVTDQGFYTWTPAGWGVITTGLPSYQGDDRHTFALTVDPGGRYFAANTNGLYESVSLPDAWALHTPDGPPGNNVINVAVQGERVYVNTYEEGIGRFDGRQWRNWPFVAQLCGVGCDSTFAAPNYAFTLLVDLDGRKWFSCWGTAIEVLDDRQSPPSVVHHLYRPPILNGERHTTAWVGALDKQGGHWFGMDTNDSDFPPLGLEFYDSTGAYRANFRPDSSGLRGSKIHGLTVDKRGRIWVGYTGQGIDYFDWDWPNADQAISTVPPLPTLRTLGGTERYDVQGLVAHGDTLWALTTSEVIAYRIVGAITRLVSYPIPAAPGSKVSVNPLAVARDGTVWVGTVNGIRVISPGGGIRDFNTKNSPLADEEVRAVHVDDATGAVWIGTARGLHRYDPGYRPPTPPVPPRLEFTVYPNPARLSALGVSLKLNGNSTAYRGEIYDLTGRRLARFSGVSNQRVVWDGHTDQGDLVKPGIYYIRVESAGKSAFARIVVLR
jgi:ligand-binding sensor domain-containing protein